MILKKNHYKKAFSFLFLAILVTRIKGSKD